MLSLLWYNARAYVYQALNQDALYMMFTRILQYLLSVQNMMAAASY